MENENPAPTTRQIFACWFTLCRAVVRIGKGNGNFDATHEAEGAKKYADELMKQEKR